MAWRRQYSLYLTLVAGFRQFRANLVARQRTGRAGAPGVGFAHRAKARGCEEEGFVSHGVSAVWNCALMRWRPVIGDPSVMGWLTVAAYFVAAALAIRVVLKLAADGEGDRAEFVFWAATGAALVCLGFNKQMDLQSLLTALGRCVAQIDGWYEERRGVQEDFIFGIIGVAAVVFCGFALALRRTLRRNGVAFMGMGLIATFVLVRAVGFHHVDALLGMRLAGWRLNWILELGGIVVVIVGALIRMPFGRASGESRGKPG